MRIYHFVFILICVGLISCDYFVQKSQKEKTPLARVGENYLYKEDIQSLVPLGVNIQDSSKLAEKYVNDWVKKQLMISRAQSQIAFDESEIERKVLDLRYALMVHEFEKLYINSHLNTEVSQEEIDQYYQEKSDNFLLRQNIIRCVFAQVPNTSADVNRFRRNIRSYPNSNKEDIEEYCYQYAIQSFLEDSLWVDFDEVIMNTPLEEIDDKARFLSRTEFSETSDDDYIYFLRILEYKTSNEVSPLPYISEDIENIIINKRKLALKKELEKTIYDEARAEKSFEIFSN